MLNINPEATSKAKCYFSQTLLPQYIDASQPPTKRKPFSTIHAQAFNHTLNLIVPSSSAEKVQEEIQNAAGALHYLKVHLKLLDIISGDFFNNYIKTGNVLLLSAPPSTGLESVQFSLAEGLLKITLDRPLYERAGLQGVPISSPNRKHIKSRYLVELNLRAPSMVKGKKGFERLRWAAENVFSESLTWLFCDLRSPLQQSAGPVAGFAPFEREAKAEVVQMDGVLVPGFGAEFRDDEEGRVEAEELLEWIGLVGLDSPRVRAADDIDGFLSRYTVPGQGEGEGGASTEDLVRIAWNGFMPSSWVAKVFMAACKASGEGWFAFQVVGFEDRGSVVLKDGGRALTWEFEG